MALATFSRVRLQASTASALTATLWYFRGGPVTATLAATAFALALLAWLSPRRHAPVQRILDRGIHLFLTAFSWLVLGLVYFGVFTPLRLLRSLARYELMPCRPNRQSPTNTTYLQPLPPSSPRHFERQF